MLYKKLMSESPNGTGNTSPPLPPLSLGQRERKRITESLLAPHVGPRPRISIADIQRQTASSFIITQPADLDPAEPDSFAIHYAVPADPPCPSPPDLTLFYTKGEALKPTTDNIKQYVLDSLRTNDAILILNIRSGVSIPQPWLTALDALKVKLSPDIDFDFLFISYGGIETFGRLYIDELNLVVPLDHDNNMCTSYDALINELEGCIMSAVSPVNKRCRAVLKEVERVLAAREITQQAAPEPLPEQTPITNRNEEERDSVSERVLSQWQSQFLANREEERRERFRLRH